MNTGVQKSGGTPEGAWTTTTPAAAPRTGRKKDIDRIMAAHVIPYVATLAAGSVPLLKDFRAKVERAAHIEGFRFLHCLGSCPPGWRYPTGDTVEIVHRASTRTTSRSSRSTTALADHAEAEARAAGSRLPLHARPLRTSLRGRTSPRPAHVDERWELLERLEQSSAVAV